MIEVPGVARCAQEGLLGQVLSLVLIAAALVAGLLLANILLPSRKAL